LTTEDVRTRSGGGRRRAFALPAEEPAGRKDEILETASRLFADTGLRTSLQDIADACGIRPGSLYHHFDSKEDIVVELVQRYHAELDHLAVRATEELKASDPSDSLDLVLALTSAIAGIADRHSAAVQFAFYEPPVGSDEELVALVSRPPAAVVAAMHETLQVARSAGFIRSGIDLEALAGRICLTMLSVGTGLFQNHPIDRVADVLGDVFLFGLANETPSNSDLDRSSAMRAVEQVISAWESVAEPAGDRGAQIRAAARTEFGRRGYEVTTVREIAAAAGVSTGAVYRVIGSKEELLVEITTSFAQNIMMGWSAALTADATPVEKIDALTWLQINAMERFSDEFRVQLAWMRQSPPETSIFGWSFQSAVRSLRSLLTDGVKSGDLRRLNVSGELLSRCLLALTWMPEDTARTGGKRAGMSLARDTVLRGAAKG
jgi:AcrR family transcriptional regulator